MKLMNNYLLNEWSYIKEVRAGVMNNFSYDIKAPLLDQEVVRLAMISRKKYLMAIIYVVVWSELMYEVWQQMYQKAFKGSCALVSQSIKEILLGVFVG